MINLASPALSPLNCEDTTDSIINQISVKFWGVRGSVPTPVEANQRYGGNTICVEVMLGEQRFIFDGGTGLMRLGDALQADSGLDKAHSEKTLLKGRQGTQAHLFFTHTQWDRIQGFPFFQPAFDAKNRFSIYGGIAPNGASIKHCLTEQMLKPYFSMPLQNMHADLAFHTLFDKAQLSIEDVAVETFRTNEMTEALGYRLTWKDRTLIYATDTPSDRVDPDFLKFVDHADILIYDGTYSDLTYLQNCSDSTLEPWSVGVETAQRANVSQLVLLHHSPIQDDAALDRLQADVCDRFPNTIIAKEGMTIGC